MTANVARPALVFIDKPTLMVDPAGNFATGWLQLQSDISTTQTVTLSARDFVSETTGQALGTQILFGQTGTPFIAFPGLLANSNFAVRIIVSNLWEAGESDAALLTNGMPFTTLHAVRARVPFGISVDGTPIERPEITFECGHPGFIVLRNADPMTYSVRWELEIGGQRVTNSTTVIPPNSTKALSEVSASGLFPCDLCGWMKDTVHDGHLALAWQPLSDAAGPGRPSKIVPIRLRVRATCCGGKILGYLVLTILLALGGACSILLNNALPNRLRRFDFQEQLAKLAEATRNLTPQLDSGLRVLVGVQLHRLRQLLKSRRVFSPDLANVFSKVTGGINTLTQQITHLQRMDTVYDRLDNLKPGEVPPTVLAQIVQSLKRASQLLRSTEPPDADLQTAQLLIADASARLDKPQDPNDLLALTLTKRVKLLRAQFANPPPANSDAERIINALPNLFQVLPGANFEDVANVTAEVFYKLDFRTRNLELVADYLDILKAIPDVQRSEQFKRREEKLLDYLRGSDLSTLRQAERMLRQLQQGIFPEHVSDEVTKNAIDIEISQREIRPNEAVEFRALFRKPAFNTAAARDDFTCLWDFGDGLTEKSWIVTHYFAVAGDYTIRVTLVGPDGKTYQGPEKSVKCVKAKDFLGLGDRAWTELLRLGLALGMALLALLGGARQQLLQLDCVPGLIAVFLLGFGADQFKNILSARNQ